MGLGIWKSDGERAIVGVLGVNTGVKVIHISELPLRRRNCFVYDFRAGKMLVFIKKNLAGVF